MGNLGSRKEVDPAQQKLNDELLLACERADLREVERLLDEGADANCRGDGTTQPWTEEDTEKLQAQGTSEGAFGSPENVAELRDMRAHPRLTPLHVAAPLSPENVALVGLLLDRKADPNARCRIKRTPIECAATVGRRGVVDLLATRGARKGKKIDEAIAHFEKFRAEVLPDMAQWRAEQHEQIEQMKAEVDKIAALKAQAQRRT
mmetsp:Transcript_53811/g.151599  ORF Transcript_53811/g.151599 Transcript_53811/m.151599 type:complete len:205 (-) Transcript_53811:98-712(-)